MRPVRTVLPLLATLLAAAPARAQNCAGQGYFEACLDAIAGREPGAMTPRDPARIIDDIFRTSDTPPRYAPELTFGRLLTDRSRPGCTIYSQISQGRPNTDPRNYTAWVGGPDDDTSLLTLGSRLDWWAAAKVRMRGNGDCQASGPEEMQPCADRAACGYESPWRSALYYDLQAPANRVVIFPVTDHTNDTCLEAFEYSVYLTDDPAAMALVRDGEAPDPARWNRAVLQRAFLRGWTDNYLSTGAADDMAAHPLREVPASAASGAPSYNARGEAIADSIATVWALPCGITFRYVALVSGNYGNPDRRCEFNSFDSEIDAVAGLNEDNTAVCRDADGDGFRDARCGGNDCDDADSMVNPAAIETCSSTRDLNCDGQRATCPSGTSCFNGICVPPCVEDACAEGFTCLAERDGGVASRCVPQACANVTCTAGQVCGPRGCQDPCADAVCPAGTVCRGGSCVDPCAGLQCPGRQHCEAGRCVPDCSCLPCPSGRSCSTRTSRCEAPGCADLRCAPGSTLDCAGMSPRCVTACEGVRCPLGARCDAATNRCVLDRCFGVACPSGTRCDDGRCVRPPTDAGVAVSDAGARDGGVDAGASIMQDAGRDGGGGSFDGGSLLVEEATGCGCRARGGRDAKGAALACVALGYALARRRRTCEHPRR